MYFDYYAVNTSTPVQTEITEIALAKYVATDWLPGIPATIMNGFADVLRGFLETEKLPEDDDDSDDYWCINPLLADTDRQWKGVTSWLLGVAFARFTVESAGYPWWSPVSAFKGDRSSGSTKTGHWLMPHPRSHFSIHRKPDWPSTLYPDYVLCRPMANGYAYTFCESKGTADIDLSRRHTPPSDWTNQVQTLDLFFNGQPVPIAEHLIVATRINPQAERPDKRKVVVRAWDVPLPASQAVDTDAAKFASFLATHYAALCWRLGENDLARLMEFAAIEMPQRRVGASDNNVFINRAILSERFQVGYQLLFGNENLQTLNGVPDLALLRRNNTRATFQLGDRNFEIVLTDAALNIMRAIANFDPAAVTQVALDEVNRLRNRILVSEDRQQQRIALTLNGLAILDRDAT